MQFNDWLHQDEGFGPRIDRMMDDIKVSVEQERTDDIIKWLQVAYSMGHEAGYEAGYSDAEDIYEDLRQSDNF